MRTERLGKPSNPQWELTFFFPLQGGEFTVTSLPLHTTNSDIFLASIGRKRKSVLGDGNCFFRTLSYILYGDQGNHQQLRVYLAKFAKLNPNLFQPLDWKGTVENHARSMLPVGTWATQVELSAIATLFRVQVFSCTPHQQTKYYHWLVFDSLDTHFADPKAEDGFESFKTKHIHTLSFVVHRSHTLIVLWTRMEGFL